MNGYLMLDFSDYTSSQLVEGVTIPGIFNKISKSKKPVVVTTKVGNTLGIGYVATSISDNGIIMTYVTNNGIFMNLTVNANDLVAITTVS